MKNIIADKPLATSRLGLGALGAVSAFLWAWVALAMPTSNRLAHVGIFLGAFAILFALYFLAIAIAIAIATTRQSRLRSSLFTILFFAALFRLLAVTAGLPAERLGSHLVADLSGQRVAYEPFLLYDNDLWRYLWDGHVTAQGLNPYLLEPDQAYESDALERRLLATEPWRDVHAAVSFRNYGTIYPPLTHFFFAALARLAPASAAAAKLALAAADLLLCMLLWRVIERAGGRRELVLVYAWNPAVIKEISGSGHPDVLMMLALVAAVDLLARRRAWTAGVALGASVLAKLASLVALPLVAVWPARDREATTGARLILATAATLTLGLWPLSAGLGAWFDALGVFADRWTFNSGIWSSLRWVFARFGAADPASLAHLATSSVIVIGALWIALRASAAAAAGGSSEARIRGLYRGVFHTLALLILLSPAVMPWYVLWALPAAVVAGNRWWPAFTGLALLSYLNYADGVGAAAWWKWLEYGTLALLIVWERRRRLEPVL